MRLIRALTDLLRLKVACWSIQASAKLAKRAATLL